MASAHPQKILVVDDNAQARLLMRRIFEREGYAVDEARSGEQAVEFALSTPPDLMLLDVQMPGMNGFEVVRALRSDPRCQHIPIIFVSAAARDPQDVITGLGLGADDYLVKPFSMNELVARARSKLRAHQLEEQLAQRTDELEMLLTLSTAANQTLNRDQLSRLMMDALHRYSPDTMVMVALANVHGELDLIEVCSAEPEPPVPSLPRDSLPGYAFALGEAAEAFDILEESGPVRSILPARNFRSGIAAPLIHRGRSMGVVALGSVEPGYFSADNFRMLRSVAEQSALALRNAQLFAELQNHAANLEATVIARTQALQTAQLELMRAEKLASLGTLAAGIAHEIGNPLQAIMLNLEGALEDMAAAMPIDGDMLRDAHNEMGRIKRILARMLDLTGAEEHPVCLVDVDAIIRDVLMLTTRQLRHARIVVSDHLDGQPIMGSADQLKQVFLNFIVNARDAMPSGGDLRIYTGIEDQHLVVGFEDTGVGIDPERLGKVFEPFFTTKPNGTGLGLAISHRIVEIHGGRISVESRPGQGTHFKVSLPLPGEAASSPPHVLSHMA